MSDLIGIIIQFYFEDISSNEGSSSWYDNDVFFSGAVKICFDFDDFILCLDNALLELLCLKYSFVTSTGPFLLYILIDANIFYSYSSDSMLSTFSFNYL